MARIPSQGSHIPFSGALHFLQRAEVPKNGEPPSRAGGANKRVLASVVLRPICAKNEGYPALSIGVELTTPRKRETVDKSQAFPL